MHASKGANKSVLICCSGLEEAAYFYSDLQAFSDRQNVHLWKDSFRRSFDLTTADAVKIQNKASVLDAVSNLQGPQIVVTYPEALAEKIIEQDDFEKNKLAFKVGEDVDLDFLIEMLNEYEFYREDFVYESGQFSIRGGIIDVYSFASELPFRLELDGRTIESIRVFDPISQLSVKKMDRVTVVPNVQENKKQGALTSIFSYLGRKPLVFCTNLPFTINAIEEGVNKATNKAESQAVVDETYFTANEVQEIIQDYQVVEFSSQTHFRSSVKLACNQIPQPVVNKNFDLLIDTLKNYQYKKYVTTVFSENAKQIERLESIFDDLNAQVKISPIYKGLSEGFIDKDLSIFCATEHQIFNRYYKAKDGRSVSRSGAISLKELRDLNPGDFVVHIDHGIGQFQGLQKMEMGGKVQEAVRIGYKNGDLLYVNIGSLYKISKFKGQAGNEPKLNKLGSDAWTKLKTKTKAKVKDIARDLIKLYARRKKEKGFAFSPDNYLQTELEASFMYEDTPDQAKAIAEVKKDLENSNPMDRLVCGDVGFGKTEVAIRAAFKAVCDSKQVAVLVPTTILAQQHYQTFKKRLEGFPCTVDYVNRFRSTKQQNETLRNLGEGKVDIIIGTHKLLNKKTKFKDLGLLVIDEEQKFGVSAKERLKEFRVNVDTLTLTATPIPRTLHFSLMGARDLSIISTPPPNRRPIQTEVHTWNNEIIEEAISYELNRGGQTFLVHNRVKDIEEVAQRVRDLVPNARVIVGHGQMKGDDLEQVMVQFIQGEYDVLVATTIIESGLDIPNANTIIINNAHMFGLSDMHQMRGRVGRSNQRAFCYLLAPPVYTLPEDGRRRLQAIEEFSDLGAGFSVAMRDLDIRGAGNLLGAEQSGFISEIGFQMYHKILDEAISELREGEFKDILDEKEDVHVVECTVEADFEALIPDTYVQNIAERINLYTELSYITTLDKLFAFQQNLEDRFGDLTDVVKALIDTVKLKIYAQDLFAEKLKIREDQYLLYFNNNLGDQYYQSEQFTYLLSLVSSESRVYSFKQSKNHIILTIKGVGSISEGIEHLKKLKLNSQK